MGTVTVTETTADNAAGIMDSLYRNAVKLAQNAQGRDDVTDEEIERAWYVLATEALNRDDLRPIVVKAMLVAAGRDAGLVDVG